MAGRISGGISVLFIMNKIRPSEIFRRPDSELLKVSAIRCGAAVGKRRYPFAFRYSDK
ncbi:Uncharacterised protein [Neisseria weaveri]|uniref:Uncharacterized protein n=1 Tax=Neisseria weaveri TaxID=28091 RepID=A0A3S5AAX4_9NEIS|nr:Uncharacterised protein [Neisseria weaveri]VEJ51375.1 Uncharacterised protein [Neisseria weaveri]